MRQVVNPKSLIKVQYPYQSDLLKRAGEEDPKALNKVLMYLSSVDSNLCGIMQSAIHDLPESDVWRILLLCFANHRYKNGLEGGRLIDQESSKRIDQALYEVFIVDENEWETKLKENILSDALEDKNQRIRQTAAYLAGMRGDLRAIPALYEILQTGNEDWKLRAVKALAALGDDDCVPPLVFVLTSSRGILHREARRALTSMEKIAESAWIDLLKHPDSHIRWEAARGLGDIGDARASDILVEGLLDENYAVRWASADVLARLGECAVPSILKFISQKILNEQSRRAAYHALHGIKSRQAKERLEPLLNALRSPIIDGRASRIARQLIREWEVCKSGFD
jgi:HEAT repeat protein